MSLARLGLPGARPLAQVSAAQQMIVQAITNAAHRQATKREELGMKSDEPIVRGRLAPQLSCDAAAPRQRSLLASLCAHSHHRVGIMYCQVERRIRGAREKMGCVSAAGVCRS